MNGLIRAHSFRVRRQFSLFEILAVASRSGIAMGAGRIA